MKKLVLVFAMAACLVGVTGRASAAPTDSITVTVSLASVISVTLDQATWVVGEIALDFVSSPFSVVATNAGNVDIDLDINGTDSGGGWTLGATDAENVFAVGVTPAAVTPFALTTGDLSLHDALPHTTSNTTGFGLVYNAPSANTFDAGVDQGFTITVTASASS